VSDGDTIVLSSGKRIRYIGINAPEIDHEHQKAEPHGYRARAFNEKLVRSKRVKVEHDVERYDRFGRELAYLYLADGTFVNAELLKSGMAFYFYRRPNLTHANRLLNAQRYAMQFKKGIWQNWLEDHLIYIGNRESRRFHAQSCVFANRIKLENRVQFSGKWNAFARGYAPDRQCIPEFWSYGKGE
jgi:micrococcal nuclease